MVCVQPVSTGSSSVITVGNDGIRRNPLLAKRRE